MLLIIDNNDSFTYNLIDLFRQFKQSCKVVRSGYTDSIMNESPGIEGVVLSPGPGRPEEHPAMMQMLQKYTGETPILGVCLGYQAIGLNFGWKLKKMERPLHGKTSTITHNGHLSYQGIPENFSVMHYHSLLLEPQSCKDLEVTARSHAAGPMSIAHKTFPVWGFQYHPESVLTENGYRIIANWLRLVKTQ